LTSDVQCDIELALEASHVTVNNEQKSGLTVTEEIVSGGCYNGWSWSGVADPFLGGGGRERVW
jgi:hypothetical protein